MADSRIQLEPILDDVLASDAEIRNGADAAGLDVDNLREVILRRQAEVWEACLAEQNAVRELEMRREELEYYVRTLLFDGRVLSFSLRYLSSELC